MDKFEKAFLGIIYALCFVGGAFFIGVLFAYLWGTL